MATGIWNRTFWKATAERALSTTLQAGIAVLIGDSTIDLSRTGVIDVAWLPVLNIAALAGVLSVVKNVIVGLSTDGNPSINSAETLEPQPRRAREDDAPLDRAGRIV